MEDRPVRGPVIFRPLAFNVDQRPLPAAKFEVLQAGELQKALLIIDHPCLMQATPDGSEASSTVTV